MNAKEADDAVAQVEGEMRRIRRALIERMKVEPAETWEMSDAELATVLTALMCAENYEFVCAEFDEETRALGRSAKAMNWFLVAGSATFTALALATGDQGTECVAIGWTIGMMLPYLLARWRKWRKSAGK